MAARELTNTVEKGTSYSQLYPDFLDSLEFLERTKLEFIVFPVKYSLNPEILGIETRHRPTPLSFQYYIWENIRGKKNTLLLLLEEFSSVETAAMHSS